MLSRFLAHGENTVPSSTGAFVDALTHMPMWMVLALTALLLLAIHSLLTLLRVKPLSRILSLIPLLIVIAVFYMPHQPEVTGVLLSVGFVVIFLLVFTILKAPGK